MSCLNLLQISVVGLIVLFASQINVVSCVYCSYSLGFQTTWCPYRCCSGFAYTSADACCGYSYSSSYWWVSLIVIGIIAVIAGIIAFVIFCVCIKNRRRMNAGGRVVYKPENFPRNTPYTIQTQNINQQTPYAPYANYAPAIQTPYPVTDASASAAEDKPPSYNNLGFTTNYNPNQPATLNVEVQAPNTSTAASAPSK